MFALFQTKARRRGCVLWRARLFPRWGSLQLSRHASLSPSRNRDWVLSVYEVYYLINSEWIQLPMNDVVKCKTFITDAMTRRRRCWTISTPPPSPRPTLTSLCRPRSSSTASAPAATRSGPGRWGGTWVCELIFHITSFYLRLSFLLVEDCNVICVDWAAGAVDPNYVRAAVNTRLVGKQVRTQGGGIRRLRSLMKHWSTIRSNKS